MSQNVSTHNEVLASHRSNGMGSASGSRKKGLPLSFLEPVHAHMAAMGFSEDNIEEEADKAIAWVRSNRSY